MDLEVVHVLRVAAHPDRVEPVLDAALEARPLVAREVEAARALQVVEEGLDVRLSHRDPPR